MLPQQKLHLKNPLKPFKTLTFLLRLHQLHFLISPVGIYIKNKNEGDNMKLTNIERETIVLFNEHEKSC